MFYVLPFILAVEGAFQPKAAWHMVGQPRWLWIGAFVVGPVTSMLTGSTLPALATVVAAGIYMAKPRSTLLIASGIERERRKRPPSEQ